MSKKSPTEVSSKPSAYKANAIPKDPTIAESEQNIDDRLEFLHDLLLATSVPKIIELLCLFLKNCMYLNGRRAGPEPDGEWIRVDIAPRLSGVLSQGSIKDRLE